MSYTPHGLTTLDLQKELSDELRSLFSETLLKATDGSEKTADIYLQDIPVPKDDYDSEFSALPYLIVHVSGGEIENWNDNTHGEIIHVELYLGVYNNDDDRSGYVELLNMIQRIKNHFGIHRRVNNFSVLSPCRWVLDEEDRHPYYFGAVSLVFEAPRTIMEDPFT